MAENLLSKISDKCGVTSNTLSDCNYRCNEVQILYLISYFSNHIQEVAYTKTLQMFNPVGTAQTINEYYYEMCNKKLR
jgi:hypothetical protein